MTLTVDAATAHDVIAYESAGGHWVPLGKLMARLGWPHPQKLFWELLRLVAQGDIEITAHGDTIQVRPRRGR